MIAGLLECGHPPTPQEPGSITTGYGTDDKGRRACFACCADQDRAFMIEHGKHSGLYLTRRAGGGAGWTVSNWPGSLVFEAFDIRQSKHGGGFGAQRTDARFYGPDGKLWAAVQRGDMDLARCRRLKRVPQ